MTCWTHLWERRHTPYKTNKQANKNKKRIENQQRKLNAVFGLKI